MEEGKREFCYIFHCQYFGKEKDVMDPFTARKQDIHSQIFRFKLERWGKKEELYDSFFSFWTSCFITLNHRWIFKTMPMNIQWFDCPHCPGTSCSSLTRIHYHRSFLFATCFWVCFPVSNGNLFLLSLCSVFRRFQVNPLIIWLSKCIIILQDLQEFASGGQRFPSLRQCIIANQKEQHSCLERERLRACMPLR